MIQQMLFNDIKLIRGEAKVQLSACFITFSNVVQLQLSGVAKDYTLQLSPAIILF